MARLVPVEGVPRLHTTPLAVVSVRDARVEVEADDINERRVSLVFQPYQALLVTTSDCFDPPGPMTPGVVVEVLQSEWVQKLKTQQARIDETATFMERARHFILPLQDDFAEVVAWSIKFEFVELGDGEGADRQHAQLPSRRHRSTSSSIEA